MWPQHTDFFQLKYVIENQRSCYYTNNVAAKQDVLFQITWPQNKRAYCYTNKVATTSVITVPKILGRKTSELIVTKIKWPQQTDLLLCNYVAKKQAAPLLHELPDSNKRIYVPQILGL